MVKFTKETPTIVGSVKAAIDMPAKYSPLKGLAEAATGALSAVEEGRANYSEMSRKAAAKAAEQSNTIARRAAADYALGGQSPGSTGRFESDMLAIELDPNRMRRLRSGEAAVRQGIWSAERLTAERRIAYEELRNQGATDEDIVKALKDMGVDKSFFRDIGLETALVEQEQKNAVAAIDNTKLIELARANGYTGDEAYLAMRGAEISKAEQDFERSRKAAELAVTTTNLNELQRKETLTNAKAGAVQAIQARAGGVANAFLAAITAAGASSLNRPEFESRMQSEVIPMLNLHLPAFEQQVTQQLMSVPGMTAEEVKANTNLIVGPLKNTLEGLQKNATRFTGIAEQLRARHGIEFARSLPVIAFLETAFGRDISTRFLELNKTQIDKLITEQSNTDWANPNAQSILMQRASMILKGELPMSNQPTDVIKTAISVTRDLSEQIAKDINLLDPSSVSMAAEGLGQLGLAGNSLSVGEGENAHFNVAANLGRPTTWQAIDAMMSNPRYRDQGDRTVQIVRSGAANGLRSLTKLAETKMPSGWKLQYNKTTGRYEAVGSRGTNPGGGTGLTGGANARFGVPDFRTSAPEQAKQFEIAANNFLSVLVATEKHGLEPIKGNAKQIREFHALGIVPEGAQKTKSKAKKADELTDETITNLKEALQRLPQGLATQQELEARNVPDITQKEFGPLIMDTAKQYNVPMNVVSALLSVENAGLDPNARGPEIKSGSHKGDRAVGLFQLMGKTAQALGVNREDVAGNIEGGIKLLAENFRRTGNWRDAISMYHSGVTYEEAKRQARGDGGMKTVDYVARILQRAGLDG